MFNDFIYTVGYTTSTIKTETINEKEFRYVFVRLLDGSTVKSVIWKEISDIALGDPVLVRITPKIYKDRVFLNYSIIVPGPENIAICKNFVDFYNVPKG